MSYYPYPKCDTLKNFFLLPNEIYHLGLSAGAIAVYGYLLSIENRETYDEHSGSGDGDPGGTTANAP